MKAAANGSVVKYFLILLAFEIVVEIKIKNSSRTKAKSHHSQQTLVDMAMVNKVIVLVKVKSLTHVDIQMSVTASVRQWSIRN